MASAREPPLLLLGVRRSGTTLLRVMLDGNPELAIPDESYFIPQLAARHSGPIDADEFVDDLRRLPTLREWNLPVEAVRDRVRDGMSSGEAVAAIYEAYAERQGKRRWGDKTPMYMQHLPLLDELFPAALYVHLIRDGRDAALSFLSMPGGVVTRTWAHPRSAADFACQWRTEIAAARRLGRKVGPARYREVRYEEFVADPAATLRSICDFAALPHDPRMLDYTGRVDVSAKPHQQRLKQAPTTGVRDWRKDMSPEDVAAFEAIAADMLKACGYEVTTSADSRPSPKARLRLGSYHARAAAWRTAARLLQRSPLWRRRHVPLA
jgi:hypothetical protein